MLKVIGFFIFTLILSAGCNKTVETPKSPDVMADTLRYETSKLIMGLDLSYVNAIEDYGGKYFDSLGKKVDPFVFLHDKGANVVRVRLWHNPDWQRALYGNVKYSQLEDVTKTIKRAKDAGMRVCLDIHYSDNWADPAKQETPKAWQNATMQVLKDSVYHYTTSVLQHLRSQNLTPEYIQVGNENNGGMCFPLGKITNNNYTNFGQLLASGISAVRNFSATSSIKPQIILHVAQLQNSQWWTNGVVNSAGIIDFDILGLSHYFLWSTVNNNSDITSTIADLTAKYNKKVLIVETAYPWTIQSADNYGNIISGQNTPDGYPVTKEGQLKYMTDLTQAVIKGGGIGVIYWEPCWITSNMKDQWNTGSSWENNTFFDFSGRPLPVIRYMKHRYTF